MATVLYGLLALSMLPISSLLASDSVTDIASIMIVNTTDDELNNDGDCSLREAVQAANIGDRVDTCLAGSGGNTIKLPHGVYTLTLAGGDEDNNATGDLDIKSTVAISAATGAQPVIDGNQLDRVLHVHTGAVVSIEGITISNGHAPDGSESGCGIAGDEPCPGAVGGGLLNDGTLALRGCVLSDNASGGGTDSICAIGGNGGGIHNRGL